MKKSKVIIPAMALLLFSTAASITGTVAWFTSTRVFSTTVGDFSVVEAEGNLECTLGAGIGTVYDSVTNTVSVQKYVADTSNQAIMTHGSVSIDNTVAADYGKAYVVNPDTGNTFFDRGKTAGDGTNGWLYRSGLTMKNTSSVDKTVDVYIAVSWTMTFTYSFAGESKPVAVYLDTKESSFQSATPDTGYDFTRTTVGKNDADKGFRIGFYNGVYATGDANAGDAAANRHDVVWGNNIPIATASVPAAWAQDHSGGYAVNDKVLKDGVIYVATAVSAEDLEWTPANWKATGEISLAGSKTCDAKFVSSTSATTDYTALNYVYYKDQARVDSGVESSSTVSRAERVCVLTSAHPSVTLTCAAWFEGCDPNVISGNNLNCLKANMTFYSRSLTA